VSFPTHPSLNDLKTNWFTGIGSSSHRQLCFGYLEIFGSLHHTPGVDQNWEALGILG
jgi:hypothetical protein